MGSSVRQMYQHARWLRAHGHETAVVATVRDPKDATETETVDGMRVFRLHSDCNVRFRPWVSLHNRVIDGPLERILNEYQPDVVHAHLVHTHLGYHALTQAKQSRRARGLFRPRRDGLLLSEADVFPWRGKDRRHRNDVVARLGKCIPCQRLRFRPGRNHAIQKVCSATWTCSRWFRRPSAMSAPTASASMPWCTTPGADRTLADGPGDRRLPGAARARGQAGDRHGRAAAREQKGVGKLLEMLALLAPRFPTCACW
ncbi:MAG: glycosyltransferase family 4 protein [Planctomycetota bacterium]